MGISSESNRHLEQLQIVMKIKIIFEPVNLLWGSLYSDTATLRIPTYLLRCQHTESEYKQSNQWKIFSR